MSKMMDKLNRLNESRKIQSGVSVEEAPDNQEPTQVIRDHKGVYFLSFLVVVLIASSAFSLAMSLKMFARLETSLTDSKIILSTLNQHGADIESLGALITDHASAELARIEELNSQMNGRMNELKIAVKAREKEMDNMKVAHNNLKSSIRASMDGLKMSDKLMLEKYVQLNDQVRKLNDANALLLNAY